MTTNGSQVIELLSKTSKEALDNDDIRHAMIFAYCVRVMRKEERGDILTQNEKEKLCVFYDDFVNYLISKTGLSSYNVIETCIWRMQNEQSRREQETESPEQLQG